MAHRGEEGRLGGIGAARLVARRREGDLGALALGDVLERPLQVGGVVLGRRYLGAQAQGARHAVRRDDLMVDLRPTNEKLRQRAIRLVEQEAHVPAEEAKRRLETWGWHVRAAIEDRWPVS